MSLRSGRARTAVFSLLAACALAANATSAGTLSAALADPKDAPAYVSACSVDNDSSGVFTPMVTLGDRRSSAIGSADVAIDFFDAQGRVLGEVVVSPPYGPEGLPFGAVDRVACKVKRAEFTDGYVYALPEPHGAANAIEPVAGALIGVGAAAALIGSKHGSSSSSSASAAPSTAPSSGPTASGSATPVPVASIVPLADARKAPAPSPSPASRAARPTPPPFRRPDLPMGRPGLPRAPFGVPTPRMPGSPP
jgi:hypothetical protein